MLIVCSVLNAKVFSTVLTLREFLAKAVSMNKKDSVMSFYPVKRTFNI